LLQDRLTSGLVELAMHVLSTVSVCDFVTAVLQVGDWFEMLAQLLCAHVLPLKGGCLWVLQ
jgi:hypothetical protein